MHVHERYGRRTGAPWSRGHVVGKTPPPAPTESAANGGGIDALPGDVLAEVLRRLRAHSLARCRCVCALWRALVDGRALLLPHALPPRAFPGFFANFHVTKPWSRRRRPGAGFLPPPASRAFAGDRLAFLRPHLPRGAVAVQHQCNGLLPCFVKDSQLAGVPAAGFVCNPVTERWARLPPPPTWWPRGHEGVFLAYDPAATLDYEVLLLPVPAATEAPSHPRQGGGHVTLGMFVPESFGGKPRDPDDDEEEKLLPLLAFSSATGQWTRRLLAPGRCAPARLYDRVMRRRRRMQGGSEGDHPSWARTWRSSSAKRVLVVLRCSDSEGTYDMVKLPSIADAGAGAGEAESYAAGHALSSLPVDSIFPSAEDGVLLRYASADVFRIKVWSLHESAEQLLEWALAHDVDLAAPARMLDLLHDAPSNRAPLAAAEEGPTDRRGGKCVWFADEDGEEAAGDGDAAAAGGGGCAGQWNWDDASLLDLEIGEDELLPHVGAGAPPSSPFSILGCHPSEEVVYLAAGAFHVVAYRLGSDKVQYLGRVMSLGDGDRVEGLFPYRPCIVDALPHDSW
ncbi:unnamed protein product [Urochloa decumbens]|uniref:F-box domain-containing protein n=1 Tax=Urochloa decumbens TaxID=240449 RepID=A0ABC9F3T1_9POAL